MSTSRSRTCRLLRWVGAFVAVGVAGVGIGFALGLARPRFGPDGDRLTWDQA